MNALTRHVAELPCNVSLEGAERTRLGASAMGTRMDVLAIGLMAAAMVGGVAHAEEVASSPREANVASEEAVALPSHRVVVRITKSLLDSLSGSKQFDRQFPVRDEVLGTAVIGTVRVVGQPAARLVESPNQATFDICFTGVASSRSTGRNGPAIIHSRAVTTFTATKRVIFEPGTGFRGSPAVVAARTETFVDGIDSTTGGLVGRIARRRASEIAAAEHAQVNEIVRQKAIRRIRAEFERTSQRRLARMNSLADFPALATAAVGSGGQPLEFCCATTEQYLQIATGGDDSVAVCVPESEIEADAALPPVQIWIHESLLGDRLVAAAKLLAGKDNAENLLLAALTAVARQTGHGDALRVVKSAVDPQQVSMREVGPWRLIEVALPSPSAIATHPRTTPSRTWTSGQYTAEAEFLALEGDVVRLQRPTGVRTSIRFEQLSLADQQWIVARLASK